MANGVGTAKLQKHYSLLDGRERTVAVLEAMARGDAAEEERLDDACPRGTYEVDDPSYRRRMSYAATATQLPCGSVRRDLGVLRAVDAFAEVQAVLRQFAGDRADEAFDAGWHAALAAARATTAGAGLGVVGATGQPLFQHLAEIRADALWLVDRPVAAVRRGLGRATAVQLLSTWDAFGRFARDCVGVGPLVLARAVTAVPEPVSDPAVGRPRRFAA